jgi:glycosyltransferase involved in cell wall biosynthesis
LAVAADPRLKPPRTAPSISLVIPAYNEAVNIEGVVREALEVLAGVTPCFEVLVGNDGSTDGTREILDRIAAAHPRVRVIHTYPNRGVAQTCLELYRKATGDFIAFFPGDGQVRPRELHKLLAGLDRFDLVVGHRRHRRDPWHRKVNAWLWNAASRLLFKVHVRDVDSVKLFPGDLLRTVPVESRSPFMETEILIRARERGLRLGNVEVEHLPRVAGRASGARLGVVLQALGEMGRFWIRRALRPGGR